MFVSTSTATPRQSVLSDDALASTFSCSLLTRHRRRLCSLLYMLLLLVHVVLLLPLTAACHRVTVDTVTMMPGAVSTNGGHQAAAAVGDMASGGVTMIVPQSNASVSHLELAGQVALSNACPPLSPSLPLSPHPPSRGQ